MSSKSRCFSSTKALRRLNPELLSQVLKQFPEYLKARQIKLPRAPSPDNMPYADIRDACMAGDIPSELDDVLFFVCILGTRPGWDRIQDEASFQELDLDFSIDGLSTADLAMKAWLHNWPNNKSLLEQSYARAKIHSRSSYVYYAPIKDVRDRYRVPSDKDIDALRDQLSAYFVREGLGPGTNVIKYDYEKEIWFLVRYPGHVQRHAAIDDKGDSTSFVFRPEEYDAIVYHKEYGDLRLNTNRPRDHVRYRIDFADLLLDAHNVFNPTLNIVTLKPLLGNCAALFQCDDVPGLTSILPVEICYTSLNHPGIRTTLKADRDTHLLFYDSAAPNIMGDDGADSVVYAKFRYRRRNSTRTGTLTVHTGNTLTYERDGDSSVLEDWLRLRGFIAQTLKEDFNELRTASAT